MARSSSSEIADARKAPKFRDRRGPVLRYNAPSRREKLPECCVVPVTGGKGIHRNIAERVVEEMADVDFGRQRKATMIRKFRAPVPGQGFI